MEGHAEEQPWALLVALDAAREGSEGARVLPLYDGRVLVGRSAVEWRRRIGCKGAQVVELDGICDEHAEVFVNHAEGLLVLVPGQGETWTGSSTSKRRRTEGLPTTVPFREVITFGHQACELWPAKEMQTLLNRGARLECRPEAGPEAEVEESTALQPTQVVNDAQDEESDGDGEADVNAPVPGDNEEVKITSSKSEDEEEEEEDGRERGMATLQVKSEDEIEDDEMEVDAENKKDEAQPATNRNVTGTVLVDFEEDEQEDEAPATPVQVTPARGVPATVRVTDVVARNVALQDDQATAPSEKGGRDSLLSGRGGAGGAQSQLTECESDADDAGSDSGGSVDIFGGPRDGGAAASATIPPTVAPDDEEEADAQAHEKVVGVEEAGPESPGPHRPENGAVPATVAADSADDALSVASTIKSGASNDEVAPAPAQRPQNFLGANTLEDYLERVRGFTDVTLAKYLSTYGIEDGSRAEQEPQVAREAFESQKLVPFIEKTEEQVLELLEQEYRSAGREVPKLKKALHAAFSNDKTLMPFLSRHMEAVATGGEVFEAEVPAPRSGRRKTRSRNDTVGAAVKRRERSKGAVESEPAAAPARSTRKRGGAAADEDAAAKQEPPEKRAKRSSGTRRRAAAATTEEPAPPTAEVAPTHTAGKGRAKRSPRKAAQVTQDKVRVLVTGVDTDKGFTDKLEQFNAVLAKSVSEATHILVGVSAETKGKLKGKLKLKRSAKLLQALAMHGSASPRIVNMQWVEDSAKFGSAAKAESYAPKGTMSHPTTKAAEDVDLSVVLERRDRQSKPVLGGTRCFLTSEVDKEIKQAMTIAGLRFVKDAAKADVIVSTEEDLKKMHKKLASAAAPAYSLHWFTMGLMRYELHVHDPTSEFKLRAEGGSPAAAAAAAAAAEPAGEPSGGRRRRIARRG